MANGWNGYRASKLAGGGLYNGYVTPKAKQVWAIGNVVKVGFVANLRIMSKDASGVYHLVQEGTNRAYEFQPHLGLTRL